MENQSTRMKDILFKSSTLRKAIATAIVQVSNAETMLAVLNKTVPKGDPFEFSRAAGLLAIKKTPDLIPDCHPIPIEFAAISFKMENLCIHIFVEVHTIYKTGVEVEAMHGASIVALTIYDMLKPLDEGIEISSIRLEKKSGGKSDLITDASHIKTAVIVCSDRVSASKQEDRSGKLIIKELRRWNISVTHYSVVPDEMDIIQTSLKQLVAEQFDLIIFTGGTGLSVRDNTPDAISPLIEKNIPGIMETVRRYGQERMPYAMLSRGVAGFVQNSLVLTLPGSTKGVTETINALFPQVLHVFEVRKNVGH